MAPEQFNNAKHADPRFDVYSLGATLYMAVTGQIPFRASTPMAVLQKKHKCELPPVRAVVPGLSERLERTIIRAMSLDPARRQASCQEFIAELTGRSPARKARGSAAVRVVRPAGKGYSGREKRAHVRYPSRQGGRCVPVAGHKEDEWVASIQDISLTGIGLLINRRFEVGTVLQIRVQAQAREAPQHLMVRVVRQQAQSPRKWLLGCSFASPLSEDELKALL
jgi:hypothetical protein